MSTNPTTTVPLHKAKEIINRAITTKIQQENEMSFSDERREVVNNSNPGPASISMININHDGSGFMPEHQSSISQGQNQNNISSNINLIQMNASPRGSYRKPRGKIPSVKRVNDITGGDFVPTENHHYWFWFL